ncbi:MAG: hypothetical protein EPO27_20945 [Betaproteobacteria bacterium]|nr:MAG: hypothetical protein EPO27_20945 [Betaproteobacteria bacterium]
MSDRWYRWYDFERESRPRHHTASDRSNEPELLGYLVWVLLLGFLVAAAILGWQVYSYLRFGRWPALSTIVLLQWLQIDWARSPRDWTGLHELLDAIPMSVVAFVGGIVPIGLWLWWDERSNGKQATDWGE